MKNIIFGLILLFISLNSSAQEGFEAELKIEAKQQMKKLGKSLKKALQNEMKANGPISAIGMCNTFPTEFKEKLGDNDGWKVGRTSLNLRNPNNAPTDWEKSTLQYFNEQLKNNVDVSQLELSKLVKVDGGHEYRYMKAIAVKPVCLACHGQSVPAAVTAKLKSLYPNDQATGYTLSEIRGAFIIKKLIPNKNHH